MTETLPAPEQKALHIVSLEINNILRIKGVCIVPNGPVITLTGENGSGKSSCLNAIAMALGGADFVPERPIRDGASKGSAILDLGDIIVEVKFSKSGKSLEVRAKDGAILKSPQAVLDSLWNKMADPVRFIRLSDSAEGQRKQAEILRQLVGLDFTKLESDKKRLYDERTGATRDLKTSEGKLTNFPLDATAPAEEVSVIELMKQLEAARLHNQNIALTRNTFKDMRKMEEEKSQELLAIEDEISNLEKQLAEKRTKRAGIVMDIAKIHKGLETEQEVLGKLVEKDEKALLDQITQADGINVKVRGNRRRAEIQKEITSHQSKVDDLTKKIDAIEDDKRAQLSAAKFPLPGLSFDESGVLLDGVPFAQGSQAQQLKAAIAIGLALNPRVRVILIREASLFDQKSLAAVKEMAEATDSQLWLEDNRSDDPKAIVIQDGEIAGE